AHRHVQGPPMTMQVARTPAKDIPSVVESLRQQLQGAAPKLLLYFATPNVDGPQLAAAMHEAFGGAPTFGCSTSGELAQGEMLKDHVVAMSLDDSHLATAHVERIDDIRKPGAV